MSLACTGTSVDLIDSNEVRIDVNENAAKIFPCARLCCSTAEVTLTILDSDTWPLCRLQHAASHIAGHMQVGQ